ncbi:MAG TPA: hypothetical protein VFU97_25065 [Xanthobacteraceae bacterium]|nr:hypothetical protein [Xanthobacteraceae bacterium]
MSTPSGKPFDRVRISDYAPKTVRDRLASSGERKSDPPDRLVTPLRAHDETPFDRPQHEKVEERPPTPLAPVGPHEHSRAEPDRSGEESFFEEDEGYSSAHEASSEAEAGAPEEHADGPAHGERDPHGAFADHTNAYEADLQRLESDLEALRGVAGDDSGRRTPPGEAPAVRELRRARETYIDGIRLPRSLEPSYLPPPPMRDRPNHLGAVQRILIACALAAPLTYFLISYFSTMSDTTAKRGTKVASVETHVPALPPMPEPQTTEAPPQQQAALPAPPAAPPPRAPAPAAQTAPVAPPAPAPVAQAAPAAAAQPPVPQQPETQPAAPFTLQSTNPAWPAPRETSRETSGVAAIPANPPAAPARVATAMPAPAATAPAPARRPAVKMDPEEVAVLLKQGEQFISTGDVVTARVLFERAAEAGNASGALALGATYDPAVLAKLGVRGIAPDVAKARQWYERARDLGSAEARGRLETLAQR